MQPLVARLPEAVKILPMQLPKNKKALTIWPGLAFRQRRNIEVLHNNCGVGDKQNCLYRRFSGGRGLALGLGAPSTRNPLR